MIAVTAAQLRAAAPNGNQQIIAAVATTSAAVFAKHQINSLNRVWGLLSVIVEESGLNTLFENMNYDAPRAHAVWPSIFPTVAAAEPYAGNPEKLANKVYGGRMGNVGPDAGWLYRGEGLDEITGENNFKLLARLTGLDTVNHPEIVTVPATMLECAVALFCAYPGILAYCDAGAWYQVWALVGTGQSKGVVINLTNHEAAWNAVRRAIPALVDITLASATEAPAQSPTPADRVIVVQQKLNAVTATEKHVGWLSELETVVEKVFSLD